ncbi:MAG: hypothetical protein QNJ55_06690 [Xenococcus sp. MO_188.B8]|nr:hypothetical protein [Xenococcus sp. MO_188.B8]
MRYKRISEVSSTMDVLMLNGAYKGARQPRPTAPGKPRRAATAKYSPLPRDEEREKLPVPNPQLSIINHQLSITD